MYSLALACGKFQPFHNEHLEYLLAALEITEHLIVGITNAEPSHTRDTAADLKRSSPQTNVAAYFERMAMVRESLTDSGIEANRFDITPFPVNRPEIWHHYIPRDIPVLITLYDDDPWLQIRQRIMEEHGHRTHVLTSSPTKGIVGEDVRRRIVDGAPWRHLVPLGTQRVMDKFDLVTRYRHAAEANNDQE